METIGEECRTEVAILDLALSMSRKALKVLPQLTGHRKLTLSLYLFQLGDSVFKFCRTIENMKVLKLARYPGCDELYRRIMEAGAEAALCKANVLRRRQAVLTELEDSIQMVMDHLQGFTAS